MNAGSHRLFWGVASLIVIVDIVTKRLAVATLSGRGSMPLLGEWMSFRLVYNEGAAFGIHVGGASRWVFTTLAIVALVVLGTMVRQTPPHHRLRLVALALICGGAVGNLIDRIRSSAGVVDFIDVWIGSYHWPTFNVADMGVSCGAIALALILWSEGRHAEAAAKPSDAAEVSS